LRQASSLGSIQWEILVTRNKPLRAALRAGDKEMRV